MTDTARHDRYTLIRTCDEAVLVTRMFDPDQVEVPTQVVENGYELMIDWAVVVVE